MKIIGVDLHTRQQTIAMLDDETGELVERELLHEGHQVREFYAAFTQAGVGRGRSNGRDALVSTAPGGTRRRVSRWSSGADDPPVRRRVVGQFPVFRSAGILKNQVELQKIERERLSVPSLFLVK